MIENVEKFFARYQEDEELRRRVLEAEASYPGSLEIREAVAEYALLPAARELGLDFTVQELRAYETRVKLRNAKPDVAVEEGEPIDEDPISYWLLDKGWEYDTSVFDKAKKKLEGRQ